MGYILTVDSNKSPPASTTASILWQNLLQALATVSLGRFAITSVIFATKEVAVLWALITYRSQMLQT
jgi:hypothetical protein